MKKIVISSLLQFAIGFICSSTETIAQSSIGSDGNILFKGKPFFPFGCYGIHWEKPQAEKMNSLVELGNVGINIVCMEDIGGSMAANFTKILDEAQKNNIKVLIGTPYAPNMKWRAIERKDHPATFGYNVADDGDNGKFTVEELTTIEAELKKEDPNHVTHLTLTGWDATRRSRASEFIAIADFASYQCYPICQHRFADFTSSNSLSETYKRTLAYVLEAEKAKKPFIMLPQTFSWGSQSNSPCYPKVSELRNMVYSGLAAGVKGIISYDFSFDLVNNQKPLWKEFKDLGQDVRLIQDYLLNKKITRHTTGDSELVISSWVNGDTTLMVVINTSYTAEKNINFTLEKTYQKGFLKPIAVRNTKVPKIQGNKMIANLKGTEVMLFKLYEENITNIQEENSNNKTTIFFNSLNNELTILNAMIGSEIYVSDMSGRVLINKKIDANNSQINLSNIQEGVYLVKLGDIIKKISKQ